MINNDINTNATVKGFDTQDCTIEMNGSMFRMLTKDTYNDSIAAVIREWSTNAIDACLDANLPIDYIVNLPTANDSTFSVRDYGTGLNRKNILGLFSILGASTKRDSVEMNGTFG